MPSGNSLAAWLLVLGWLPMLVGVRRTGFAARERSPGRAAAPDRGVARPVEPRRRLFLDVTLLLLTWLAGAGLTIAAVHDLEPAQHPWRTWAGVVLFLAAVAAWTWMRRIHGAAYAQLPRVPGTLVTRGPYRVVRHPLYLATVCAGLGQCVAGARVACLGFWLLLVACFVVRAAREEEVLAAAFGNRWDAYAHSVPAALPSRRRR